MVSPEHASGHGFGIAALLCVALGGCTTVRPVDLEAPIELASDEGLLLLQIDTELAIGDLRFGGARALSDLPSGEHLILLAVSEGSYRWTEIAFPNASGEAIRWRLIAEDLLEFRIEAGRINYLGQMVFEGKARKRSVSWRGFLRNRSGEFALVLRERFAGLAARYPPRFGGWHRDDFIERYAERLGAARSSPETTESGR